MYVVTVLVSLLGVGLLFDVFSGSSEEDETLPPEEENHDEVIAGTSGTDDLLAGGAGDDTLSGNAAEPDSLDGGEGADLLHLASGNTGSGGAGADSFFAETLYPYDGPVTITDFDPVEDSLHLDSAYTHLNLYRNEDDSGFILTDAQTNDPLVRLNDFDLSADSPLTVHLSDTDPETGDPVAEGSVTFTEAQDYWPLLSTTQQGTDAGDALTGTQNDDYLFGEEGADTLNGGDGDDLLLSGSGQRIILGAQDVGHLPGLVSELGDDGDVLEGGAGDDTLMIGPDAVATGGAGADTFATVDLDFNTMTDAPYAPGHITDFTPGEDVIEVSFAANGPGDGGVFLSQDDAVDRIASGFEIVQAAGGVQTVIQLNGNPLLTLAGQPAGLTMVFRDSGGGGDTWLDANGDPITEEQARTADIIMVPRSDTTLFGDAYESRLG